MRVIECGPDPLQYPPGCLRDGQPDRLQYTQHGGAIYRVDRPLADDREHVIFEARHPRRMRAILPPALHRLIAGAGDRLESRRRFPAQSQLLDGIEAIADHAPVIGNGNPRLRERYVGCRAEAKIASSPAMLDPQYPRPRAGIADDEIEPVHIGVATGPGVSNLERGERHERPSKPHI